jgi:predicted Ser/Thr protein kinase
MESELVAKLIPNAVSAVAVIVVVWMFLKAQKENRDAAATERKEFIQSMRQIRDECHVMTENNQRVYREQMTSMVDQVSKVSNGYEDSTKIFAGAISANGVILGEVRDLLAAEDRRGSGRREKDWKKESEHAAG